MKQREAAKQLRTILDNYDDSIISEEAREDIEVIIDKLDPPQLKPGDPILWKWPKTTMPWRHGIAEGRRWTRTAEGAPLPLDEVEWKPARILADDEVAIPVEELVGVRKDISDERYRSVSQWAKYYIDRTEAEAREAKQ